MAETNEGGTKEFSAFLKGCRTVEDAASGKAVTLRGHVYRSGDGAFALAMPDGQVIELPPAAVERFKVVGTGTTPEVELTLSAEALKAAKGLPPIKSPHLDHKQLFKDIRTDPIVDQTWFPADQKHLPKDLPKDFKEVPTKELAKDPPKELIKDGHKDPLSDPNTGIADLGPTFAEQIGVDPRQGAVSPDAVLTPFVMATPHHAPAHMVNLQAAAAPQMNVAAALKPVQGETFVKEAAADFPKPVLQDITAKELISDQTLKELVFDTHKEVVFDTRKELVETQVETTVEGGGTLAEGHPGGFPGMPLF